MPKTKTRSVNDLNDLLASSSVGISNKAFSEFDLLRAMMCVGVIQRRWCRLYTDQKETLFKEVGLSRLV